MTTIEKFNIAPVGWRILVRDYAPAKVTESGLLLPDESVDHAEYLNYIGEVMELGPYAYKHKKFGEATRSPLAVGKGLGHGEH